MRAEQVAWAAARGLASAAARAVSRIVGVPVVVARRRSAGPRLSALTFDDGPDQATTPALLEVLAQHGAHATFFLLGERAAAQEDLVRAIVAGGHELGNHLLRDEWSVRLPAEQFERQLTQVHELLSGYGPVRFFRPGSGWFTPRMLRAGARLGYGCALGTPGLAEDRYPHPARLAARLAGRCRPGSVIVLHEGTPARAAVAEVTDRLLAELAREGQAAVTLSELLRR